MTKFSRFLCLSLVLLLCSDLSLAQVSYGNFYFPVHRPAGLDWQQLKTDHFRIIYPKNEDSLAYRAASILENQYPKAVALSGGELKNFPVIFSNYSDLSNGFVTSNNFRSEFAAAPFKGKSINPKSGDWFEAVLPHELLHATHGSVLVPWSIPAFYDLFSPDLARSFNFFPPVGVHEGLAVLHESENVAENGGRKNYTYFNNQYNARLSSNDPWSAGQTFQPSRYTLPYNRHYISGSTFTQWLHENYGENVSKDAIRYQHKFFFLGYGFALKHVTGKWPSELYTKYIEDKKAQENARQKKIGESTSSKQVFIESPYKGVTQRKPFWTSSSGLVFFSLHYNAPRGFYTYNLDTKKTAQIAEVNTVGDYNIDYDRAANSLLFAEYDADLLYSSAYKSELKRLDLDSNKQFEITEKDRVYSPTISGAHIIALQTNGASANVIAIDGDNNKTVLATFNDATPVAIKANPNSPNQLALIINRRGIPALWITTPQTIAQDILEAPRMAFKDASIFDLDWHPSEQKLLFTADFYPAMNIYELNLSNGDILQKTNSLFNAFEASYSPDASSIAYVVQQNQEQKVAVLNESNFYNKRVPRDALLSGSNLRRSLERPLLGSELSDVSDSWTSEKYGSDLSWLKPRAVLPIVREKSGANQVGVNFQSIDALSSQSYSAELTGIQSRLWYDLSYTNKTFWPGFRLRTYSDPSFGVLGFQNSDPRPVMLQERGFDLSIPVNFTFNATTRGKSLFLSPRITAEQIRYFDLSPNPISDFETQYKAGGFAQLSWNILSQRRDIQPSSGISLFGFLDKALNDPIVFIENAAGNPEQFLLADRWAAYYGVIGYLGPLKKFNQSLRYDFQFLNQSSSLLYSQSTIIPNSFTDNAFLFNGNETFNNLGRFSTRYTIPVAYPGDGGMLVPFYLQAIYISTFSHTITNLEQSSARDLLSASRSVFGAGLHFQFNVANLTFDFGVGFSFEPTRNKAKFVFGDF